MLFLVMQSTKNTILAILPQTEANAEPVIPNLQMATKKMLNTMLTETDIAIDLVTVLGLPSTSIN